MPWSSNADLPKSVKDNLPEEAQTMWRKTVNSALREYSDESRAFATGWAVLRRNGWSNKSGTWTRTQKESPTSDSVHCDVPLGEEMPKVMKEFSFKIEKSNEEKRIAFGWAMISRDKTGCEVFDYQNDGIDPEDLEQLAYRYVQFYRDAGSEHNSKGKGVLIESVVSTLEKQSVWGVPVGFMPIGWWVGFYVTDDAVWEKVKSGEYAAFSIEGDAVRKEVF